MNLVETPELEDSRSKLQRQALGNVRRLYEKLDNKDTLDRRTEHKFMIGGGVVAIVAIVALGISAMTRSSDSGAVERARCVQEARVAAVWELKSELSQKSPAVAPGEMDALLQRRFDEAKAKATIECERVHPKPS